MPHHRSKCVTRPSSKSVGKTAVECKIPTTGPQKAAPWCGFVSWIDLVSVANMANCPQSEKIDSVRWRRYFWNTGHACVPISLSCFPPRPIFSLLHTLHDQAPSYECPIRKQRPHRWEGVIIRLWILPGIISFIISCRTFPQWDLVQIMSAALLSMQKSYMMAVPLSYAAQDLDGEFEGINVSLQSRTGASSLWT